MAADRESVTRVKMHGKGPEFSSVIWGSMRSEEQFSSPHQLAEFLRFLLDRGVTTLDTANTYGHPHPYTVEEFNQACIDIILANGFESCYLRPLVYRGFHSLGVFPGNCPVDVCIAAWEWGKYLGKEALELGVDVRVASWERMAPNTFPAMAKATGNYLNSQLIRLEADADGYSEGIALDVRGYVSEGSGENIFIVRNNIISTPTLGASVLPGITRDSILTIARDLGFKVIEQDIPREFLYVADEVFFTGTAAEVTPIRSIDRITVGEGRRGPVTEKIQSEFFAYIAGEVEDRYNWLTPVVGAKKVAMAAT